MENGSSILGHPSVIPLLIGNESIVTDTKFDIVSPLTQKFCHESSSTSIEDANSAAAAAQAAFPQWSKLKPNIRRGYLWKAADIMDSVQDELVRYQQEETGAAPPGALLTVKLAGDLLREAGAMINFVEGTIPSVAHDGQAAAVFKEPYGVILGIAPWYDLCPYEKL